MMTFNAKVGTMPMRIIVRGNKPPAVGKFLWWREDRHRTKWEHAVVDRLEPILFISRM